tara:strand:- start:298 stop:870 length:573 start_codon:yes stop_codon:yes gene_type:complete
MEMEKDKKIEELDDSKENPSSVDKEQVSVEERLKDTEDKLLRALAEIENQRRRFDKEIKDAFDYGGFNFAKEALSLIDNLQRAYVSMKNDESLKNNKDLDKFLKNVEIIEKDLISIFEKNNIKKIQCLNKKFDPNNHQAMLEVEDENLEQGTIVQEIQPGYMLKDRLLRPSFVGISKKKEKKSHKNEEKK